MVTDVADDKKVTRRDMEVAGARIAAREGITVDELRAEVAKMQDRDCERCGRTFATTNVRKRFCDTPCRASDHRANGEAAKS